MIHSFRQHIVYVALNKSNNRLKTTKDDILKKLVHAFDVWVNAQFWNLYLFIHVYGLLTTATMIHINS